MKSPKRFPLLLAIVALQFLCTEVRAGGLPYILFVDTKASPAEGRQTAGDAVLFFMMKNFTRAFQQVQGENTAGLQGMKIAIPTDLSAQPQMEVKAYNPLIPMQQSPMHFFLRVMQAFDRGFQADMKYLEHFMKKHGRKSPTDTAKGPVTEPESGVTGVWPTKAMLKLYLTPWASPDSNPAPALPPGARSLLVDGRSADPLMTGLRMMKRVPFFLAGVKDLYVAPLPQIYRGVAGKQPMRDRMYDGFRAAAQQETGLTRPALSDVRPKGMTLAVNLNGSFDSRDLGPYSYMNILLSMTRQIHFPFKSASKEDGVYIDEFLYNPDPWTSVVQLTLFRPRTESIPPYAVITFGKLAKTEAGAGSGLMPAAHDSELPVVTGDVNAQPHFIGSLDLNTVVNKKMFNSTIGKLWKTTPFKMYFERIILQLEARNGKPPFSIVDEMPTFPLTWRDRLGSHGELVEGLETVFNYAGTKFGIVIPKKTFTRNLTKSKVAPAINQRLLQMIPSPGEDYDSDQP